MAKHPALTRKNSDRYPTDPPTIMQTEKTSYFNRFIMNFYMFTAFPFVEAWNSLTKKGSCGLGALAACFAWFSLMGMAVGGFIGWAVGWPPYLTCWIPPVFLTLAVTGHDHYIGKSVVPR